MKIRQTTFLKPCNRSCNCSTHLLTSHFDVCFLHTYVYLYSSNNTKTNGIKPYKYFLNNANITGISDGATWRYRKQKVDGIEIQL